MHKKSQFATTDFYIASIIFLILIVSLTINLYTFPKKLDEGQNKNEMLITAYQFSDSLVKNTGNPSLWEENATLIKVIGLVDFDRVLYPPKVNKFINFSYDFTKDFTKPYEFYLRLLYYNGTEDLNYGMQFNGSTSITIRRHIIYNDEKQILEITIWK
ncbi:MAG: hypothetical protein AABW56_05020 [Nanoarchaeota archaeon]